MRRFHIEGDPNADLQSYDFDWDNEEHIFSDDVGYYGVRIVYVEFVEDADFKNVYGVKEGVPGDVEIDLNIIDDIDFDKVENTDKAHIQVISREGAPADDFDTNFSRSLKSKVFVNVLCSYEEDRTTVLQGLGVDPTDPCDLEQFYTRNTTQELETTHRQLEFKYDYVSTDTPASRASMPEPDFSKIRTKTFVITGHNHTAASFAKPTDLGYSSEDKPSVGDMDRTGGGRMIAAGDVAYISYEDNVKGSHYHDIRGSTLSPSTAKFEVHLWLTKAAALRGDFKDPSNWPTHGRGTPGEYSGLDNPGLMTDYSIKFFGKTEAQVEEMIAEYNEDYPSSRGSSGNEMNTNRDRIGNYIHITQTRSINHNHSHNEQVPVTFDPRISDKIFNHLRDQIIKTKEFRIMFDFSFDLDKYTTLISNYAFLANTSQEFEEMFSQTKFNTAMLAAIGSNLSDYGKSFEECNSSQASRDFELPSFSWNPDLLLFMLKTPLQIYKGWAKTADPHCLITQTIVELLKLGYIIPEIETKQFEIPNSEPPKCLEVPMPVYPGIKVDFPGITQVTALGVTYAPLIVGAPPFIPTPFGLIYYAVVDPLLFLLDGISSTNVLENKDLKEALGLAGITINPDGSCIICDEATESDRLEDEKEDSKYSLCELENEKTFNINMSKFGKVRGC